MGAEQLVDEREERREVLRSVLRQGRVVDAMPLRSGNDARKRPETHAQVRVVDETPEAEHEHADERRRIQRAQHEQHRRVANQAEQIVEQMAAALRRRVHHRVAVVELVRLPQERRRMLPAVDPVVPGIPDQRIGDGHQDRTRQGLRKSMQMPDPAAVGDMHGLLEQRIEERLQVHDERQRQRKIGAILQAIAPGRTRRGRAQMLENAENRSQRKNPRQLRQIKADP
ncbi:hypothetical protein [Rudaea sp.]|uniref:hypothetical protein n=1 Tax=Rudaea sp. TaxID=2136325 RepID=UPI0032206DE2